MKASTATPLLLVPTAEPVEQKETALAVIPESKVTDIFLKGEGIDELLDACEKKATAITADVSTAKGRAEIKSMAYLVTRTKTAIDAVRKALADEYKEKPKRIDANGKRIKDFLEDLQERVRKPLTDWEDAEKARVAQLQARIDGFGAIACAVAKDSSELMGWIELVQGIEIDDTYQERKADAAVAKDRALTLLRGRYEESAKREAEAAELARLREEQAKREQEEREARIAQEAAEKATREAEEKARSEKAEAEARELRAKLAQEQAERAAAQAIADAEAKAQAAAQAERRRIEAEAEKAQAEEAARQADDAHKFRIHGEILEDFQNAGADMNTAMLILDAIRDGEVRNLKIIY